jgi:hypothetical protein
MGARDALAEDPALEPQLLRVTDPGALQAHRAARRIYRPFLVAVAVSDRLTGALITAAAEKLCDLVLQRLLQNQPGTEAPDRLDRIILAGHSGQHLIQLVAKPLARGYLLHAGVPPSLGLVRTKRRLRPQLQFPRLMGRDHTGGNDGEQARPRAPRGHEYTYKLLVGGIERLGNGVGATCTGSSAVIPRTTLYPDSANTACFFGREST